MATSLDFIEYVCEQISGVGSVRYRKMFGEYMVYVEDKPILLVCDNTVFVKIIVPIEGVMQDAERGFPYEGAKEHYILDIDQAAFSQEIIRLMLPYIEIPKSKKKKLIMDHKNIMT